MAALVPVKLKVANRVISMNAMTYFLRGTEMLLSNIETPARSMESS